MSDKDTLTILCTSDCSAGPGKIYPTGAIETLPRKQALELISSGRFVIATEEALAAAEKKAAAAKKKEEAEAAKKKAEEEAAKKKAEEEAAAKGSGKK